MLRMLLVLILLSLPGLAAAQAKGAPAAAGCARYTEADKRAKCEHRDAQTRKDADRKKLDQQRNAERHCAKVADEKQRAECEKKEMAKVKS